MTTGNGDIAGMGRAQSEHTDAAPTGTRPPATAAGHRERDRIGLHVSPRSRSAVMTARTRRTAIRLAAAAAAAALTLAALAAVLLWRTDKTTEVRGPAPTSHASLARGRTPASDPGDIVIGVNGSGTTIVARGESYVEGGAHAVSKQYGVLTPAIETSGHVDTSVDGDYPVRYTVRDGHGHIASVVRTVRVVDTMDRQTGGVPVLMYHYVYDPANPPAGLNANFIAADALEAQLKYLTGNGFYYPSWAEVRAFVDGTHSLPARSVVLTFDDGEEGFFRYGGALLTHYRVPATSFIVSSDGGELQRMRDFASPYIEYETHSHDMHRAGGTVGHGGRISAMNRQEIVDDLTTAQRTIGSLQAFAYPFGDSTPDAQEAVRQAGVPLAFTTEYGWAQVGADPTRLPRVRVQGGETLDAYTASIQ